MTKDGRIIFRAEAHAFGEFKPDNEGSWTYRGGDPKRHLYARRGSGLRIQAKTLEGNRVRDREK